MSACALCGKPIAGAFLGDMDDPATHRHERCEVEAEIVARLAAWFREGVASGDLDDVRDKIDTRRCAEIADAIERGVWKKGEAT